MVSLGLLYRQLTHSQACNRLLQDSCDQEASRASLLEQELALAKQQLIHESERSSELAEQQVKLSDAREKVLAELAQTRERLSHQQATEQGLRDRLESQERRESAAEKELIQLRESLGALERQHSALKESLDQERQHAQEKLALLENNRKQLKLEFEHLANQIFESKQQSFEEQSRKGLDTLLSPFKDQLENFRKRVDHVYASESQERTSLRTQIEELHKLNRKMTEEAGNLTKALRGENKTQGNWGELMLETVLERSGLRKGLEYRREQVVRDDQGKIYRPDVIIDLPEGKHVIVDAKVSLNAYTSYVNAEDEVQRDVALRAHIESVRQHIRGLSDKAYQKLPGINSPDFVFLFMPVEPAFMVAFERDERLFMEAFEKRIVVVTPTTLLATLRTVSNLWSLERQNNSARELADLGAKVYDKLRVVVEAMEKLGKQIDTSQKTWHEAWNSLREGRGNLVRQSQRFLELGVRVKKELPKSLLESADGDAGDQVSQIEAPPKVAAPEE
ncbi:DNA recombination protein RmuC [Aestuariirhabdus litorea]|uniref:DNA recombination protein RmuC n=2 Tax=Aestuariirhabdus litorea TaxID=2528527 RepID=A0A3P3VRT8_9GAMM|nr:DNA recombination protein RmuC [Aestuariirhabdus litorea]RWW98684.1 DNA recombination protein RmuC [Endozoicomonadaceae bacterium GTF-13]